MRAHSERAGVGRRRRGTAGWCLYEVEGNAAISGAAGAGTVLATRGREVELAEGTEINATLAAPFSIRVEAR